MEVFALDDLSTGEEANISRLRDRDGFHLVVDSVLSQSVVSELVHRCDVVYHLAAAVGVRLIVEQPGRTLLTNVQGAENVLDYCARFEKPVLIASSPRSTAIIRKTSCSRRTRSGSTGRRPRSAGRTPTRRRWTSSCAGAAATSAACTCVIARLFNTVGPRQNSRYGNVIPRFVQNALAGGAARDPRRRKPDAVLLPRLDVVRALKGLLELADGEIYNARLDRPDHDPGTRRARARGHGIEPELVFVPYDEVFEGGVTEEMFHRAPAIGKIEQAIGWEPTIGLDGILADVIESVRLAPAS